MFAEVIVSFRWEDVRPKQDYLQSWVLTNEDAYALNVAQGLNGFPQQSTTGFLRFKTSLTQATTTRRSSHQ